MYFRILKKPPITLKLAGEVFPTTIGELFLSKATAVHDTVIESAPKNVEKTNPEPLSFILVIKPDALAYVLLYAPGVVGKPGRLGASHYHNFINQRNNHNIINLVITCAAHVISIS